MTFSDAVWTAAGAGLILLMLADVLYTLLYPHGSGPVCRAIMRGFWHVSRTVSGRSSAFAAPAAMAAVIAAWAALAVVGWAFLYLPHLRDGFVYADGVPQEGNFTEALYISMVALSTVGFGEIVAGDAGLRLLTASQAITGFGLLAAAVSWILQAYPALGRRRALAHELNLLREASGPEGLTPLDPHHAAGLLESLARQVSLVSIDLLSFYESYYFHEVQERGSLPDTVSYAQQLADDAQRSGDPELRFAGRMLTSALDDLAQVLRNRFGHSGATSSAVFDHYAVHHRHRRVRAGRTP
ncbi:potassium channel family protein [Arthrobacter zhaoguopingii]|uniref:potassium channel family protein n=1 Tax=Arthrobacter zhaoguopingii TaxID=2681491 RepID=UPI00135914BE|nr:potassium channel family protein [Arthrobacter zhaoguopingii]